MNKPDRRICREIGREYPAQLLTKRGVVVNSRKHFLRQLADLRRVLIAYPGRERRNAPRSDRQSTRRSILLDGAKRRQRNPLDSWKNQNPVRNAIVCDRRIVDEIEVVAEVQNLRDQRRADQLIHELVDRNVARRKARISVIGGEINRDIRHRLALAQQKADALRYAEYPASPSTTGCADSVPPPHKNASPARPLQAANKASRGR